MGEEEEEEEEEEEAWPEGGGGAAAAAAAAAASRRALLLRAVCEAFLSGAEGAHFDYAAVDADDALDGTREAEEDAAEAWFARPGE